MASDPTPQEDLPPHQRFERLVKGPEPHVFRSVRPDPYGDEDDDGFDPADDSVDPSPAPGDADLLHRFDPLKEELAAEAGAPVPITPIEPAAPPPPSSRPPTERHAELPSAEDQPASLDETETLDTLQARIRRARREEREVSAGPDRKQPTDPTDTGLTDDELEQLEQSEAKESQRESKKEKRRQKRKNRSFWKELPILILVALVVAIIIKTFFFQAFYIPSGSMIPTLEINDRVLVNKLSYQFGAIERGDVLVFDSPEAIDVERSLIDRVFRSIGEATGLTSPDTVLIKRVIGLPGQTVEVRDNQVYLNGNPIAEPYLPEGVSMRDMAEVTVQADHVFMMGDNRNQSRDSRVFGSIPREDIVGRAFVTVWPPAEWGGL